MKPSLLLALLLSATSLASTPREQQIIPNVCFDAIDGSQFCTTDYLGNVQVFIFNAGWCPPCNQEMGALAAAYPQFSDQRVTFASLSGEGSTHGSKPDVDFMQEWKDKHNIPFVVASKFRYFGKDFDAPGGIPFIVVVDRKGKVAKKGYLESDEVISLVRQLVTEQVLPRS